jgi:hypothetical protein
MYFLFSLPPLSRIRFLCFFDVVKFSRIEKPKQALKTELKTVFSGIENRHLTVFIRLKHVFLRLKTSEMLILGHFLTFL